MEEWLYVQRSRVNGSPALEPDILMLAFIRLNTDCADMLEVRMGRATEDTFIIAAELGRAVIPY